MGRDLTVVRGASAVAGPAPTGAEVRVRRRPARQRCHLPASRSTASRSAAARIETPTAYYFSFDETFNVGVDRGTPVVDDYLPVHNRFEGRIPRVRFDLEARRACRAPSEDRVRAHLTHQ